MMLVSSLGSSVVAQARTRANAAFRRVMQDWAGVPRGPLGWISTHTVLTTGDTAFREVAAACQLQPDDAWLDVACGSGAFLAERGAHVGRVAGIDLSDLQVGIARRALADRIAAGTAEVVKGDAAAMPWPDASFTVVTATSVFEVFPDAGAVLDEMVRVLRPGGRAVLNIGERVKPGTQTHEGWGGIPVWSEEDARGMVERAGFTDVTVQYVDWAGDNPVGRLFAKVAGPLGGDLRLVRGRKPR
jgi:SAM-dependent methyltransferase